MTRAEIIRAIKNAEEVFVWAKVLKEDGMYVRITKSSAINAVNETFDSFDPKPGDFLISFSDGNAYIN
jgi:hypothetical protein